MSKLKKLLIAFVMLISIAASLIYIGTQTNLLKRYAVGQEIDSFNGVVVYYNGSVGNVDGRRVIEGYNVGLKFQCVEFVKRFYLIALKHKMPDSYGHAKSFYDSRVGDGKTNNQRNLLQFTNGSRSKPAVNDLLVFDGHVGNPYGHVAIISKVSENSIEIIQQNAGPFGSSRATYDLDNRNGNWLIDASNVLGWLRKK